MLCFKKSKANYIDCFNGKDNMSFLNKFDFYKVVGDSMNPFLQEGNLLLCSKNIDNLKRGSIVIFNNKSTDTEDIKRIIGIFF